MTRILKYVPIKGTKYRDWIVCSDEVVKRDSNRSTYWKVQCKCGKIETRSAHHIINGKTGSCRSCAARKNTFEESYFNQIKRRAIKNNFECNLSLDYIITLIKKQNFKCNLSGLPIEFKNCYHGKNKTGQTASLDRIDSSKGYIKGNVQWVHKDINFMKGVLSQERFIELCGKVVANADR